jgi:hypothetical protein
MKIQILTGMACAVAVGSALAADDISLRYDPRTDDRTLVAHEESAADWQSYHANEFEVSLFGSGTVGRRTLEHASTRRLERNGKLGLGAGASYFFHRNFGIEGYAYSESTSGYFVDNVAGDLIARLPLGHSGVALYGLGGGGRQLDPVIQWTLDAGGGVEWRFLKNVGIFADARYVWADKTRDYGLGRIGLKFGF